MIILPGESNSVLDVVGVNNMKIDDKFVSNNFSDGEDLLKVFKDDLDCDRNIFRGGPVCFIDGKEMPPFVTYSPSGGITSEISTNALKHVDKFLNLDRSVAIPSLQIDGYGSRFDESFLTYTNPVDEMNGNKWNVLLGTPYGTSLW